jgi:hypothetical protein
LITIRNFEIFYEKYFKMESTPADPKTLLQELFVNDEQVRLLSDKQVKQILQMKRVLSPIDTRATMKRGLKAGSA